MGCNCSKRIKTQYFAPSKIIKDEPEKETKKSKLDILKELWESAKKEKKENADK